MNPDNAGGSTLFVASVEEFDKHDVTTKADNASVGETTIKNLTALLFGSKNNGPMQLLTQSPLCIEGEKINFVISTAKKDNAIVSANLYNIQESSDDKTLSIDIDGVALESCKMYIVANMMDLFKSKGAMSETEFKEIAYTFNPTSYEDATIQDIGIPVSTGFPMVGEIDVDITKTSENAIPVKMKKLFAKVNFKFMVRLDADGPGSVNKVAEPYFKPESWRVYNVPTRITLGEDVDGETAKLFSTGAIKGQFKYNLTESAQKGQVYDSPNSNDYFEFSFYMPEHMVTPYRTRESLGISEEEKRFMQCHKPTLCVPTAADQTGNEELKPKYPTYVQIKGSYSDHQGHLTEVTYDLYLGQNEIDDFNVKRNQELNNIVVIKGITNHSQGTGISCDHRVNVSASGYSIGLERETLLDSHFEFRPMKITVEKGHTVYVEVPKTNWFGAEDASKPLSATTAYDSAKPGLRKYFTTNLVSELWAGVNTDSKVFSFAYTKEADPNNTGKVDHTLWFYFDENVNMKYDDSNQSGSDPLYRQAIVKVHKDEITDTPDREYAFRQMSLWAINSSELKGGKPARAYGIEYFEEYLYNYASDDNYGVTKDGMEWGLTGQQLSTKYQTVYADADKSEGLITLLRLLGIDETEFYNDAFEDLETKYDFYLTRDEVSNSVKKREYAGIHFTQELINQGKLLNGNQLTSITIADNTRYLSQPNEIQSAVEYCYNKNKRSSLTGNVERINWYLPSIDETEEILVNGFSYFPVFQSKYYWSSQPAFKKFDFNADASVVIGSVGKVTGTYYRDDTERARATRVTVTESEEDSGVNASVGYFPMTVYTIPFVGNFLRPGNETEYKSTDENYYDGNIYQPGNQPRATRNRVRCAYSKTGLSVTPISAN